MFVSTGFLPGDGYCVCSCDIERSVWEKHPYSSGVIENLCTVGDYMYAVSIAGIINNVPQRYSFAQQQWQTFSKSNIISIVIAVLITLVGQRDIIQKCMYFMDVNQIRQGPLGLCRKQCYIVSIPTEISEKKKHQPVILILGPVFL